MNHMYVVPFVNPEPWAVGTAFTKRLKGGKLSAGISPNPKLVNFQNAFREHWEGDKSVIKYPLGVDIALRFFFWREIELADTGSKVIHGQEADATNLQKATEDAMQGIFFDNDRQVKAIMSEIIMQRPHIDPGVVFVISTYKDRYNTINTPYKMAENALTNEVKRANNQAVHRNKW